MSGLCLDITWGSKGGHSDSREQAAPLSWQRNTERTEKIAPQRQDGPSSQADVLARALDLLGLDLRYPILGSSIPTPGRQEFVLMQFNDFFGFRRGDEVAVFRPGKVPATFRYEDGRLHAAPKNAELERDGLSLIHVTEDLYDRRLYR